MLSLLAAAESHRDWALTVIEDLVRLESPSTDKSALDRVGAEIARLFVELGARAAALPQERSGDHLRIEIGRGDEQVLVIGHFDTVWPIGQIDDDAGAARGRPALRARVVRHEGWHRDDAARRAHPDRNRSPAAHRIAMIWTSDEEIGSDTSRAILEAEARRSRAVFVLEPALAGGGVKTARKGVADFRIEATGISAHAGVEPDKGASAIHELAWQAVQLLALHDPSRGLTINVGCIGGGTRRTSSRPKRRWMSMSGFRPRPTPRGSRPPSQRSSPRDPRVRSAASSGGSTVRRWNERAGRCRTLRARRAHRAPARPGVARGRDRRRIRRQLHRGPRHSNPRRPRPGRRRRPRACTNTSSSIRSPSARRFSPDCRAWTSRSSVTPDTPL